MTQVGFILRKTFRGRIAQGTCSDWLTRKSAMWSNGNITTVWNGGGVMSIRTCNISERCKIGLRVLCRTNRKSHSHTRFQLVQKSMTLDNLESLIRYSCRNRKVLRSPPLSNWSRDFCSRSDSPGRVYERNETQSTQAWVAKFIMSISDSQCTRNLCLKNSVRVFFDSFVFVTFCG